MQRGDGEHQRGQGFERHAEGDDLAAVVAVGDVADDERERGHGQELGEADEAQVERAAGERIDLPAHGDGDDLERQ